MSIYYASQQPLLCMSQEISAAYILETFRDLSYFFQPVCHISVPAPILKKEQESSNQPWPLLL